MPSIEERLTKVETLLKVQGEKIDSILSILNQKIAQNGTQDVTIARLDTRLSSIEKKQELHAKWLWSTLGTALAGFIQGMICGQRLGQHWLDSFRV